MSDSATKTLPQWSTFGTAGTTKVTFRGREFTLTKAQEDAAQALARGEFVHMARRSGKNLVRQRVLDILAQGGAKPATGRAPKQPTVFTLVKEYSDEEARPELLGTFASKTGAKAAAQADYVSALKQAGYDTEADDAATAIAWTNDKNNADSDELTAGTSDFRYTITGKTLRK